MLNSILAVGVLAPNRAAAASANIAPPCLWLAPFPTSISLPPSILHIVARPNSIFAGSLQAPRQTPVQALRLSLSEECRMTGLNSEPFKIAVVWRGDAEARKMASAGSLFAGGARLVGRFH